MEPRSRTLGGGAWPAAGNAVEYVPVKVRALLRPDSEPGRGEWFWSVNPYGGCELACTFCRSRLDREDFGAWQEFERRITVKTNAVEAFIRESRAEDFAGRQVVLGSKTEAWQPAEERVRVTRALLEAMAQVDGVDLRINTRSSLIARDADLLKQIAARGRVTVAFSLASMDERVNRLMEPKAPSAWRRLSALEALARAGLDVGLLVSPVLPGLDDEELGLSGMLTRAANAGARFAGLSFLSFDAGQRERFLSHVTTAYPKDAVRFRRVIGRKGWTHEEQQEVRAAFESHCARLGLLPLEQATAPQPRRELPPRQLPLFA